jgi:hypothetical protein
MFFNNEKPHARSVAGGKGGMVVEPFRQVYSTACFLKSSPIQGQKHAAI